MARIGCQIKGTGRAVMKASFGGVAAITDAIGTAVPASTLTSGIKTSAASQAEKKEIEKDKPKMKKGGMPPRNKKNFRSTKSGAGMTAAGVAAYRRMNPGSKLKTAVTGKVKKGSKAAKRRKSYCARSAGQMKMHNVNCSKTPDKRICAARRRWKC